MLITHGSHSVIQRIGKSPFESALKRYIKLVDDGMNGEEALLKVAVPVFVDNEHKLICIDTDCPRYR